MNKIVANLNGQITRNSALLDSIKTLNTEKGTLEKSNKSLTDSIRNLNIRVVNLNSQIEKLKEKGNLNINNESGNKYIGNNVEIKNGSSNSGNIIIGSGNYCR